MVCKHDWSCKPIIRIQTRINSTRKTTSTLKNPVARTRPLKMEFYSLFREVIGPNFILPFATFIRSKSAKSQSAD